MRQLLYFMVVYNQADAGQLKEELSAEGMKKYGKREWESHLKSVQESWDRIEQIAEKYLDASGIPINRVRIYQDGLPAAGEIGMQIVREVAGKGSKNYRILENLVIRGACLEEAESRKLLRQEHDYLSRILKAPSEAEKLKQYIFYLEASPRLLAERDRYTAEKINTTLNEDEFGLAFFGGTHSIVDKLAEDIEVTVIDEFHDKISADLMAGVNSNSI